MLVVAIAVYNYFQKSLVLNPKEVINQQYDDFDKKWKLDEKE